MEIKNTKKCRICKQEKDERLFAKNKRCKKVFKYTSKCLDCDAIISGSKKEDVERSIESIDAYKTCRKCFKNKKINDFSVKKNGKINTCCKDCCSESLKYYENVKLGIIKPSIKTYQFNDEDKKQCCKCEVWRPRNWYKQKKNGNYYNSCNHCLEYSNKRRIKKKENL